MVLNNEAIGNFIQNRRKLSGLTQAELSERLHVTEQAVSNWERGESLPNTALLPDLAMILDTSVDELLGAGSCTWRYRRRVTVERMAEAINCIRNLHELLGSDHFMYRTMVDALNAKMNSNIEQTFSSERYRDAYICEAILACARNGDYVDVDDVKKHIGNEKARDFTIKALYEMGMK